MSRNTPENYGLPPLPDENPHRWEPAYLYCMGLQLVRPYIKIGYTKQPAKRLKEINGGSAKMPAGWAGQTVDLLALRIGTGQEETRIHRDLREYRVGRSEWFMGHLAVADYVQNEASWVSQSAVGLYDYITDDWPQESLVDARRGFDASGLALEQAAARHLSAFLEQARGTKSNTIDI